MSINLKPYQEKAVNQLVEATVKLLDFNGPGEVCVFQAPTGSGKTVITAIFIECLIKELPNEDLCFVWMSIGKGDLHVQSKRSLEKIFGGFPRVSLIEGEFNGGRERIIQNEVVVASWEKLRSKDGKTGDWKNLAMKDGEKINFRDVLEKTKEQRKIILIIDESHTNASTGRAQELRGLIGADVTIEMSATPRIAITAEDIIETRAMLVKVNAKDVIEEGMIKKELVINEDIGRIAKSENDSQTVVLEASYNKRLELKKAFVKEDSDINPLVLIQIPTAEAGEQKIEAVKKFLTEKGVTEKNGKLAIWLSDQKSDDLEWIAEPDNEIEFLIFKQAIDTGWDCPRAHILVKFRETTNIVFEIQTVGRILRMPEQKHYENETLNRGYIYTNLESISVKKEEYNPNIIKHLKANRVKGYKPIKLESYYKARADYGDITSSFTPEFEKVMNREFGIKDDGKLVAVKSSLKKSGIDVALEKYQQQIIADTHISAKNFDELQGDIDPTAMAKLSVAADELQIFFEQMIKAQLGPFRNVKRSIPSVKTAIYLWFRKYLNSEDWHEEILLIQKLCMYKDNLTAIQKILTKAVDEYKTVKDAEVRKRVEESEKNYIFELPIELFYNEFTDEIVKLKKFAYEPNYLNIDRSAPEKSFEKFLNDNASKITWWWKNGENKQDCFGIKYEYSGAIYTFYPDYLVQFSDGKVGIFEVKDSGDRDGKTYTTAKAEALQKYIATQKNKKLFGGIAVERNKEWVLNQSKKYDWEKCEKGDWGEWGRVDF